MRALVTGSAGFIGTHLVKALRAQGHDVDEFDGRCSSSKLLHEINSTDLRDVTHVFHLAAKAGVQQSWDTEEFQFHYSDSNIVGSQRVLDACISEQHPPRVIYASSSSVYGDGDGPISPYGVSKKAGEDLMRVYAKRGVPTVSLRYFTVYGPWQRPDMAFRKWIEAAAKGKYLTVYGDGSQRRSFTYVEDVVKATILAATADVPSGSVFDVGGPKSVTIGDAVATLRSLLPYPVNVKFLPAQPGDPQTVVPDPARQLPGWQPLTDLRRGLEQQIAWQLEVLHA